jgi:hypothetical protein
MISYKYNYIFVHIPKTGGSTFRNQFEHEDQEEFKVNWNHLPYERFKKEHPFEFNHYLKFTWVRNTWDRVCSWFYFHKRKLKIPLLKHMTFKKWVLADFPNLMYSVDQWNRFYDTWKINPLNQLDFFGDAEYDFVGRFENFHEDYIKLCDLLKISDPPPLKHENKTDHKPYMSEYTDEMKEIVADRWADEIEFFDYKFGS